MTLSTEGQRLRQLREDLGMNQTEFASSIGIKQSHLSAIENDNSSMSLDIMKKLFDEYSYNPLYHIKGIGVPIIDRDNPSLSHSAIFEQRGIYAPKDTDKKILEQSQALFKENIELTKVNMSLREKIQSLQDKIIALQEKLLSREISS